MFGMSCGIHIERIANLLSQGETMKDYGISVLDQYQIEVYSTRRIRGAVLCDTDKGLFILKETHAPAGRLPVLAAVYKLLSENGFQMIDVPLENKEGEYVTQAEDGSRYMVKRWFQGRECDIRKESELLEGVRTLARLHEVMRLPKELCSPERSEKLSDEYDRHNRELRKVRAFVCKRSVKGDFEREFLKGYDQMYQWAQRTSDRLKESEYQKLYRKAQEENTVVHGDYNYHNLLSCAEGMAVTGFEHVHQDLQLVDLWYFLRKTLEKHRYDERLGYRMLRAYDSIIPLGREEREYLAIRLAYPEKFWKTANTYYHSNKALISSKSVEKLETAISQAEEKKRFLANIFAFQL